MQSDDDDDDTVFAQCYACADTQVQRCTISDLRLSNLAKKSTKAKRVALCAEHDVCPVCTFVDPRRPSVKNGTLDGELCVVVPGDESDDDTPILHAECARTCIVCSVVVPLFATNISVGSKVSDFYEYAAGRPKLGAFSIICDDCVDKCDVCGRLWMCNSNKQIMYDALMCMSCIDKSRRRQERDRDRRNVIGAIDAIAAAAMPGRCLADDGVTVVHYPKKRVWSEWMGAMVTPFLGSDGMYPDSDNEDNANDGYDAATRAMYLWIHILEKRQYASDPFKDSSVDGIAYSQHVSDPHDEATRIACMSQPRSHDIRRWTKPLTK